MGGVMARAVVDYVTPFLSIWVRPRPTIRKIVDSDPDRLVLLLAGTWYTLTTLMARQWWSLTPHKTVRPRNYFASGLWVQWLLAISNPAGTWPSPGAEVLTIVLLGGILGIVWLYANGALLKWTGQLLGGRADSFEVRAAFAWGTIPWIASSSCGLYYGVPAQSGAFWPYSLGLYVMLYIWGIVVLTKCVSEVHRFSAWRGLGAVVLWLWSIPLALFLIMLVSHWVSIWR